MMPLKEHTLQQETVWLLPDSWVSDEESYRYQQESG